MSASGLDLLLAHLPSDNRAKGDAFERLCSWYLINAPEYRRLVEKVWLWDEWPGRWAADAGIDLVVRLRSGDLWAVQAKAYDRHYALKKADIDSFLSESSREVFSSRLLIATTDHLGATARRTLSAQEKPVATRLLSDLRRSRVMWPADLDFVDAPSPVAPRVSLPHQQEAVEAVVSEFSTAGRCQVTMACGTGKTLVGLRVNDRLAAKRTLVLVPSLALLQQTLEGWCADATEPFEYLAVCSDDSVAERDALLKPTIELGVPVTTDPARIAAFVNGRRRSRRVIFSTYQSSPQIEAAFRQAHLPRFDLIVCDEAHRCAGPASGAFTTVLADSKIPARRRVFMTATPRYFTRRLRKAASDEGFEVVAMDDRKLFGPVAYHLGFAEAIDRGLLADYRVAVVAVDDDESAQLAARGAFVIAEGESVTDARTLARELAVARAMKRWDLRRVVTFHSRVHLARRFSEDFPGLLSWLPARRRPNGVTTAEHVSGKMSSGERAAALDRFAELLDTDRAVLSNARCLNEGVDVPAIDGVAFIDPRRSQTDIIQAVGRAIRKTDDGKPGTIVIPVVVSPGQDADDVLSGSEFQRVWSIVKALRAHDDVLSEQLDGYRRELGRRGSVSGHPGKLVLDLPVRLGKAFADAFDARLVEETSAPFETWLGLLERYVAEHGHAAPPHKLVYKQKNLGFWVLQQRLLRKQGALAPDREEKLATLPGWSWNVRGDRWDRKYEALAAYAARVGHARPSHPQVEQGERIGWWVANLRQSRDALSAEKRERLETLPGWSWDPFADRWEEWFAVLQDYVAHTGDARPSQTYTTADGRRLGSWVALQRQSRDRLTDEQRARLEGLPGWSWDPLGEAWDAAFDQLRTYFSGGASRPPAASYVTADGTRLGWWCVLQRDAYRKEKLAPERASRLESLEGWAWEIDMPSWENGFARLQEYVRREGHAQVPRHYHDPEGYDLARYVTHQREKHRKGTLEPSKAAQLEALPGWKWSFNRPAVRTLEWDEWLAKLEEFAKREGHARVPGPYEVDGYPLGQWVTRQRQIRDRLNTHRQTRLEALPGWTWDAREAQWEDALARLAAHCRSTGSAHVAATYVTPDGFKLGRWAVTQRRQKRLGMLSAERARRLEQLPGWRWEISTAVAA